MDAQHIQTTNRCDVQSHLLISACNRAGSLAMLTKGRSGPANAALANPQEANTQPRVLAEVTACPQASYLLDLSSSRCSCATNLATFIQAKCVRRGQSHLVDVSDPSLLHLRCSFFRVWKTFLSTSQGHMLAMSINPQVPQEN